MENGLLDKLYGDQQFKQALIKYMQIEIFKNFTFERHCVSYAMAKRQAVDALDKEILNIDWFDIISELSVNLRDRLNENSSHSTHVIATEQIAKVVSRKTTSCGTTQEIKGPSRRPLLVCFQQARLDMSHPLFFHKLVQVPNDDKREVTMCYDKDDEDVPDLIDDNGNVSLCFHKQEHISYDDIISDDDICMILL
jgi:hypothetical protein